MSDLTKWDIRWKLLASWAECKWFEENRWEGGRARGRWVQNRTLEKITSVRFSASFLLWSKTQKVDSLKRYIIRTGFALRIECRRFQVNRMFGCEVRGIWTCFSLFSNLFLCSQTYKRDRGGRKVASISLTADPAGRLSGWPLSYFGKIQVSEGNQWREIHWWYCQVCRTCSFRVRDPVKVISWSSNFQSWISWLPMKRIL